MDFWAGIIILLVVAIAIGVYLYFANDRMNRLSLRMRQTAKRIRQLERAAAKHDRGDTDTAADNEDSDDEHEDTSSSRLATNACGLGGSTAVESATSTTEDNQFIILTLGIILFIGVSASCCYKLHKNMSFVETTLNNACSRLSALELAGTAAATATATDAPPDAAAPTSAA